MRPTQIHLDRAECWALLQRHRVGRLAVDVGGRPDIFPINYVVDGDTIVFRSGAGTKLAAAVLGRHVAFEIDGARGRDRSVWSVTVRGVAREVDHMEERFAIEDLPLYPWIASDKPNFVRIQAGDVTGRRFHVVEGIDVDGVGGIDEGAELSPPSGRAGAFHPGEPKMRPD